MYLQKQCFTHSEIVIIIIIIINIILTTQDTMTQADASNGLLHNAARRGSSNQSINLRFHKHYALMERVLVNSTAVKHHTEHNVEHSLTLQISTEHTLTTL